MVKFLLRFQFITTYSIFLLFALTNSIEAQIPNFHIGTKWIYETVEGPLPIQTGFELFQITDTTQLHGKSVFVIEDGYGHEIEFMHVENTKVYFWDEGAEDFQLTYDFGSDSLYTSSWHACSGNEGEAVVRIDSVTTLVQQGDSLELQHVSIKNNGSTEDDLITGIYKNIGLMEFGLRLALGFDVCDFDKQITKLRCFENDSVEYHFVDYPCDSSWLSLHTSIINLVDTYQPVYPNPSSGIIHISDTENGVPFQLFNLQGVKIQSGILENGVIRIEQQGMFILRLFQNSKWINRRVVGVLIR